MAEGTGAGEDGGIGSWAVRMMRVATGGAGWANNNGWMQGEPCTGATANWHGLIKDVYGDSGCNSDGSIWGM